MNPTSTCVFVAPEKAEEEKGLSASPYYSLINVTRCKMPLCSYPHFTSTAQGQVLPWKAMQPYPLLCMLKISVLPILLSLCIPLPPFSSIINVSLEPRDQPFPPSYQTNEKEIDRDATVHLAFSLPPWTPSAAALAEITSVQIKRPRPPFYESKIKCGKKSLPFLIYFSHSLIFFVSIISVNHLVHILSKDLQWLGVCVGTAVCAHVCECACMRMQASNDV